MKKIKFDLSRFGISLTLLALILFFSVSADAFLTTRNILNVLRQVSIVGICAVGMTMVILTGGIDLSVGSVIGVSVDSTASLMVSGIHPIFAVILSLLLGGFIGLINGFFINRISVPPLITTLAMMTALRGVAYKITDGLPVYGFPESFAFIGQGYVLGIPFPVIIMVVVFIFGYILLNKTKFGRYLYGLGGNEEATRLSGINVTLSKYKLYALEGFLAALAGIVLLSRVNSGQPKAGSGYEMDIITVVDLAHSKNIPFINPNQAVKGYDVLIGLDEYEFGYMGGEIAAGWIAGKLNGRTKAAIIGYPFMQDLKDRAQGLEDAIMKSNPATEIVAYGKANTPESGMNEALSILRKFPEVKVISCINDAGALGALEAVKTLGLDATAEALGKMNEPGSIFRGTVDIDPYGTGIIVIDTALWVLEKGPIPDLIPIPMKPVVQ